MGLRLLCGAVLVSSFVLAGGGTTLAADQCLAAELNDRFVLPDGSVMGASRITLCTRLELSPVARIHEIAVDGRPMGLVTSRLGRSEGPARIHPTVLFRRMESGALRLIGYSVPDGRHSQTFLMQPRAKQRAEVQAQALVVRARTADAPQAPENGASPVMALRTSE